MKMRTFSVWPPPCARLRAGSGDCLPAKRIPPLLLRTNPGSSSALTWRKRGESPLLFLGSSPGGGRGCPGRKCGGATKARLTQKMIIILCQYHINFPPGRVGFGWVGRESGAGCWRLSSATDKDEYGQKKSFPQKHIWRIKIFFLNMCEKRGVHWAIKNIMKIASSNHYKETIFDFFRFFFCTCKTNKKCPNWAAENRILYCPLSSGPKIEYFSPTIKTPILMTNVQSIWLLLLACIGQAIAI